MSMVHSLPIMLKAALSRRDQSLFPKIGLNTNIYKTFVPHKQTALEANSSISKTCLETLAQ